MVYPIGMNTSLKTTSAQITRKNTNQTTLALIERLQLAVAAFNTRTEAQHANIGLGDIQHLNNTLAVAIATIEGNADKAAEVLANEALRALA